MRLISMLIMLITLAGTQALAGEKAIRIGVSAIKAGCTVSGGPGAVLAAQMAADDYGGKALGKPIELISADLLNKPDVAAAIAGRWYDVEGVDVITECR